MVADERAAAVEVRAARPDEERLAPLASALIDAAADEHDIARRAPDFLASKIRGGKAAVAFLDGELVGFGYWSDWEGGRFVSHSGLVVRPELRGLGVGHRLKEILFATSRERFPDAATMSLTTSPQVRAMNLRLGFEPCSFDDMTTDPAFWEGCRTCRNYAEVRREGLRCCCEPMLRRPRPREDAR